MGVASSIKGLAGIFAGRESAPPPVAPSLDVEPCTSDESSEAAQKVEAVEPISGFTCVIEYKDVQRLISCRSFKMLGEVGHIGAVCKVGTLSITSPFQERGALRAVAPDRRSCGRRSLT